MKRRSFLKTSLLGTVGLGLNACIQTKKTHIFTLSFDDGFKKSFYKIADIYDEHGLSACLNIIASGHLPSFQKVDEWILPELMGNFDDWNALQGRGHEIMPHSWQHLNLANQPLDEAKELIVRCLDYFEEHLDGFDASRAVFNYPFNSSTPELEQFTLTKVRALRSSGETALNVIPSSSEPFLIGCQSMGPGNIDHWVEQQVNDFLKTDGGWLVLNVHGLDDEGWGPMSTTYLENLIARLVQVEKLEILPAGEVLKRTAS
ncbi:polysaccharide deacetylase family protein [Rhodohalobacter sulfatireducens]|uniref:Polysaccharide deacetylase family protein n=1 Tax=Rhodohalobacter sulfatireducens TaxID=2911366 RepID=A0ABS9KGA2_9BACT|nr:polysaccharide deacetylase family protein [Rhodohalobacter sulfatireducens]MCG2589886.1 polysaccharide deacetylase family protein [Rhodohalobacter sulfatireducens]